ncbi:MAG TPA: hypothetical protein ENI16_00560 [Candidatus Portnoybacteria bacterium]|nr:hypothetical protein [Candidatus Portnoybacteria bacterium]
MTNKLKNIFAQSYWWDKIILISLGASFLINLALWIYLALKFEPSPSPLIVHYDIYSGTFFLGNYWQVYTIPLTGSILIIINFFLSYLVYSREKLAAYFLIGLLPLVQAFLFIAGICLVLINS